MTAESPDTARAGSSDSSLSSDQHAQVTSSGGSSKPLGMKRVYIPHDPKNPAWWRQEARMERAFAAEDSRRRYGSVESIQIHLRQAEEYERAAAALENASGERESGEAQAEPAIRRDGRNAEGADAASALRGGAAS